MKKELALLLVMLFCAAVFAQGERSVAVYMSGKNRADEQSDIIGAALNAVLVGSKSFTTMLRKGDFLEAIAAESLYQHSGAVDNSQISEIGKSFGVAYICVGELVRFSDKEYLIIARLIDVESATIVGSAYRIAAMPNNPAILSEAMAVAASLVADFEKRNESDLKNRKASAQKERAAVYMAGQSGSGGIGEIIHPLLIHAVSRGDKYAVSERTGASLESLTEELRLQHSDVIVEGSQKARRGYHAGVKYIMAIKIIGRQTAEVRLIDIETGEVPRSRTGTINTANVKSIEKSVADLIGEFLQIDPATIFTELIKDIEEEEEWKKKEEERKRREEKERLRRLRMPDPKWGFKFDLIEVTSIHTNIKLRNIYITDGSDEYMDIKLLNKNIRENNAPPSFEFGVVHTRPVTPKILFAPQANFLISYAEYEDWWLKILGIKVPLLFQYAYRYSDAIRFFAEGGVEVGSLQITSGTNNYGENSRRTVDDWNFNYGLLTGGGIGLGWFQMYASFGWGNNYNQWGIGWRFMFW